MLIFLSEIAIMTLWAKELSHSIFIAVVPQYVGNSIKIFFSSNENSVQIDRYQRGVTTVVSNILIGSARNPDS